MLVGIMPKRTTMTPEKERSFLKELEVGKIIQLESVEEFLDAVRLGRKKYGRKSIFFCDDMGEAIGTTGCIVLLQENPEKAGRFCVRFKKVCDYMREHKLDWDRFHSLYDPETVKKQKITRAFMDADSKIHRHFNSLSDKRKKAFIDRLRELAAKTDNVPW